MAQSFDEEREQMIVDEKLEGGIDCGVNGRYDKIYQLCLCDTNFSGVLCEIE